MIGGVIIATVSAIMMEPLSAVVHRHFGHRSGWRLHRDHHESSSGHLQRNDVIPLLAACLTMAVFAISYGRPSRWWLFSIATGVSAFGLIYALVHDVYIHRRLPLLPRRLRAFEPWRRAHLEHHRTGGAPFGVLVPLRPRRRTQQPPGHTSH